MKSLASSRSGYGKVFALCALGLAALLGSSCHTKGDLPKYVTEFYLEAPNDSGLAFTLPISQLTYRRMADSFLDLSQLTGVEQGHVTVTMGDGSGIEKSCVFFLLNADGQERLNIATGSNQGRRIFLFLNDKPIGVRFIDQSIENGQLFMFLEVPDKDLPDYVKDLKASIAKFKALKNK
jgi:hypothetical protein